MLLCILEQLPLESILMDPNVRAIYLGLLKHGLTVVSATILHDMIRVAIGRPAKNLKVGNGRITFRDVIIAELR